MGSIRWCFECGRIESKALLKQRNALIMTAKWTVWLKLTLRSGGKTSNPSVDRTSLVNRNGTINSLMTPSIALGYLLAKLMIFFTSITHEFEPLTQVQTTPNVISSDLLVSLEEVSSDLLKLPTQKAVGPDGISNKLLKEFAPELAPLIQDIYNQSLREGFVPDTLKWYYDQIFTP